MRQLPCPDKTVPLAHQGHLNLPAFDGCVSHYDLDPISTSYIAPSGSVGSTGVPVRLFLSARYTRLVFMYPSRLASAGLRSWPFGRLTATCTPCTSTGPVLTFDT